MKFSEIARSRRSVRKFDARKVDKKIVDALLETTFTAPSSKNSRTTRIAVVDRPELLAGIAAMRSAGSGFVEHAPLAFVIMGDDSQTDLWNINSSISATFLQLACEEAGLGSCWVQVWGRPHREGDPGSGTAEEYLHEIMPELAPWRILCVVAAGYLAVPHSPRTPQEYEDKVTWLTE